ncbi:hypothetical protein [Rhizobium sp. WL3]|uniref:hypothetical protein n=1 Tax=Rhizobium sp. WL3 TaxID=2603277 RepID=UPI0032B2C533
MRLAIRHFATRVVVQMPAGVPALGGDVDAAAEGQHVVDDHDLLVMGGGRRMRAIQFEVDVGRGHEVEEAEGHGSPSQGCEQAQIPFEDMDLQIGTGLADPLQKPSQLVRPLETGALRLELDPGVEIPADQVHHVPGFEDRLLDGNEIVFGVKDHTEAVRARLLPTVSTWLQDVRCHASLNPSLTKEEAPSPLL